MCLETRGQAGARRAGQPNQLRRDSLKRIHSTAAAAGRSHQVAKPIGACRRLGKRRVGGRERETESESKKETRGQARGVRIERRPGAEVRASERAATRPPRCVRRRGQRGPPRTNPVLGHLPLCRATGFEPLKKVRTLQGGASFIHLFVVANVRHTFGVEGRTCFFTCQSTFYLCETATHRVFGDTRVTRRRDEEGLRGSQCGEAPARRAARLTP